MNGPLVKTVVAAVAVVLALGAGGCGSAAGPSTDRPPEPSSSGEASAGEASAAEEGTTPLDGTWEAEITQDAFVAYAREQGVRRRHAMDMVERDLPGPDFSVKLLGGFFNVTGPTGESWHQGRYEVHGDQLHLIEPGGFPPFRLRYELAGDRVRFTVAEGQDGGPEHIPGVPAVVAGGALWCSVPWERVA